jgi:hypothetical protein
MNQRYKNTWYFDSLHTLFNQVLDKSESDLILTQIIPNMVKLALDLPNKICQSIPILKQG